MCTHNLCFRAKNIKIVKTFQLKIVIFAAVKNRCMLHGRVFVMTCEPCFESFKPGKT